jgi:DNA-binding XRE family transcriptional regulator
MSKKGTFVVMQYLPSPRDLDYLVSKENKVYWGSIPDSDKQNIIREASSIAFEKVDRVIFPAEISNAINRIVSEKQKAAPVEPSFGYRLHIARKERRLTLASLSKMSGVSLSYISDIEHNRGNVGPSIKTAEALISALGMTQAEFYSI